MAATIEPPGPLDEAVPAPAVPTPPAASREAVAAAEQRRATASRISLRSRPPAPLERT